MSCSTPLLSKELFQCSVCLDVFTHPVSLPCGHTFCQSCILAQWTASGSSHCPKCSTVFQETPELRENSFAHEMAKQIRKQKGQRSSEYHRFYKHAKLSNFKCKDFTLQTCLSRPWTVCLFSSPTCSMFTMCPSSSLIKLTMTLPDVILAVDMTLDPDTANPWLVVSADRKCVTDGNEECSVPNNAERFDTAPCVLSREPISRGRTYWEVGVSGKTAWDLGVARKSVNRKGLVTLSPQDGYWAVCLRGGSEYRACDRKSVLLSLKTLPQRIGIYVDYEKGQVTFYDTSVQWFLYCTNCIFYPLTLTLTHTHTEKSPARSKCTGITILVWSP
uniref:B30.2/SPRY domain-containing protein n=1 Tax=Sinocyclocheilus rhinocerous TaxID=307959 RepID=A0A673JJK7_9TELE